MIGLCSKDTDGQMYTSSSIKKKNTYECKKFNFNKFLENIIWLIIISKSVYDCEETNNLFTWNMVTYNARKVLYEKVQVNATVRDSQSLNSARDDVLKGNL